MPAREPLVDLPLDRFVDDNPRAPPQKRPLSPGSTIISPAKRRMLAQGGLAFPSARVRSPLVDFGAQTSVPSSLRSEGVARKLDFGMPTPSASRASPAPASSGGENVAAEPTRTRTSPRLAARIPSGSTRRSRPPSSKGSTAPLSREPTPSNSPLLVPRELPTPHRASSPSHPGFDIPFDTHVEVSRQRASVKPPSSRGSSREPDGENKENLRPTRKARKSGEGSGKPASKSGKASAKDDGPGAALRRSPRLVTPNAGVPMDIDL
ncbi:unnamed protein product [Peniophora sp. CBMAI 1063]|nr:unnamed protein product [Peniophora sp. CBMAI 1063]